MIEWSHFSHFWPHCLLAMVPLCTHAMFSRRNLLKESISLDIIISLTTQRGLMKWQILLEALFMSMFMIFSWILGKYERKYKSTKKKFTWILLRKYLMIHRKKMKALMPEIFHKSIINNILVISAKYHDHTPILIFSSMWH